MAAQGKIVRMVTKVSRLQLMCYYCSSFSLTRLNRGDLAKFRFVW